jgi:hypothetical protein
MCTFAPEPNDETMKKGQRYTNGEETYLLKSVSKKGIKLTAERESDGAVVVFDWEGLRGFVQRYAKSVTLGTRID